MLGNIANQRELACLSREMPQQIGLYMQHLRKYCIGPAFLLLKIGIGGIYEGNS